MNTARVSRTELQPVLRWLCWRIGVSRTFAPVRSPLHGPVGENSLALLLPARSQHLAGHRARDREQLSMLPISRETVQTQQREQPDPYDDGYPERQWNTDSCLPAPVLEPLVATEQCRPTGVRERRANGTVGERVKHPLNGTSHERHRRIHILLQKVSI